jgi:hypothetical protein
MGCGQREASGGGSKIVKKIIRFGTEKWLGFLGLITGPFGKNWFFPQYTREKGLELCCCTTTAFCYHFRRFPTLSRGTQRRQRRVASQLLQPHTQNVKPIHRRASEPMRRSRCHHVIGPCRNPLTSKTNRESVVKFFDRRTSHVPPSPLAACRALLLLQRLHRAWRNATGVRQWLMGGCRPRCILASGLATCVSSVG